MDRIQLHARFSEDREFSRQLQYSVCIRRQGFELLLSVRAYIRYERQTYECIRVQACAGDRCLHRNAGTHPCHLASAHLLWQICKEGSGVVRKA